MGPRGGTLVMLRVPLSRIISEASVTMLPYFFFSTDLINKTDFKKRLAPIHLSKVMANSFIACFSKWPQPPI